MHTLHWIAVEAENEENAVDVVDQTLDSYMSGNDAPSTWYDWYIVGGGRWNVSKTKTLWLAIPRRAIWLSVMLKTLMLFVVR